jgi:hypothetical protein
MRAQRLHGDGAEHGSLRATAQIPAERIIGEFLLGERKTKGLAQDLLAQSQGLSVEAGAIGHFDQGDAFVHPPTDLLRHPCISGCDLYRIAFFALKATMVEDSESRGEHLERMKAIHKGPAPKFKRHDPQLGRIRSEAVLFEEMEHAAQLLQSEEDFGRFGTNHALHACYSFLHARGLSGQGLKPLIDLMAALESVASGVLPELFDPKLKPGRMPERKWSRSAAREIKIHAV